MSIKLNFPFCYILGGEYYNSVPYTQYNTTPYTDPAWTAMRYGPSGIISKSLIRSDSLVDTKKGLHYLSQKSQSLFVVYANLQNKTLHFIWAIINRIFVPKTLLLVGQFERLL